MGSLWTVLLLGLGLILLLRPQHLWKAHEMVTRGKRSSTDFSLALLRLAGLLLLLTAGGLVIWKAIFP